jgi:chromosome partitioning protein
VGRILTITTSRGGAGKTTLARLLGVTLADHGHKVAVVDADPNKSFWRWHGEVYQGPPITCVAEHEVSEIVQALHGLAEDHGVVICDTAGFGNQTAALAAGAADLVLIPLMGDRDNVVEVLKTAKQVGGYAKLRGTDIPVRVVKSRWHPAGLAERATLEDLEANKLAALAQHVSDRADFAKLTYSGEVPRTGRIRQEADEIVKELERMKAVPARAAA